MISRTFSRTRIVVALFQKMEWHREATGHNLKGYWMNHEIMDVYMLKPIWVNEIKRNLPQVQILSLAVEVPRHHHSSLVWDH